MARNKHTDNLRLLLTMSLFQRSVGTSGRILLYF